MIPPIAPVASLGADTGPWNSAQAEAVGASAAEAPEQAPSAPQPLSIDVARAADGVFVYTLTDPGTGAVLAVIPRQDVQIGRDGRNLDQRV